MMQDTRVALVAFTLNSARFALEAACVQAMSDHRPKAAPAEHCHRASSLFPSRDEPSIDTSHWLTLGDDQGSWYLEVASDVELVNLPESRIHPLPALLIERRQIPALVALGDYQGELMALLDARLIRPCN
ncbi:hypothetical protein VRRI112168_13285 [Vreelandella rituensis]|uniref:CheW-like domain-containing protein n=1 Tax=Vreelandella rituensis TaxID=2282306 RepID=A0A368TZ65_9GAMM|nr:hypothetical protein [Halomonas rituensis]RCV89626.1 hypothetical protein DU506_12710 [Halomonas rituensis]